jgi:hypothetical protein
MDFLSLCFVFCCIIGFVGFATYSLSSFWVLSLRLVFGDFISGLFNVLGRGPREKMVLVHTVLGRSQAGCV